MSNHDHRILLHIMMLSGNDPFASKKADSTFLRFNNILNGNGQLPNLTAICNYCDGVNKKLGAYIRNECLDIKKDDTVFDPRINKTNSMFNAIEPSERKKVRILLYPGDRNDISDLNLNETTHNMIVQFNQQVCKFSATEPHGKPPSFYQVCTSEETALLYFEALLIDACLCHYLSVSDVAYHHDDKQRISLEKVMFLREIVKKETLDFLSPEGQQLVSYIASQLHTTTPYISFLSIFTIAPFDLAKSDPNFSYTLSSCQFEDYCNLWSEFQKWYFDRHGRLFSKHKKTKDPLATVFNRNKYQGQISPSDIANRINILLDGPIKKVDNPPFGLENRYAVIIIKHIENNKINQFEALFSGQLYPSKWDIIHLGDIERYDKILPYLEVVPFMISE